MAIVTINITADQAAKLQIATYSNEPHLFPEGAPVILNRATNAVLLASDGTGNNYKGLTDAQLTGLINNGKPADDADITAVTRRFWSERIKTAAQTRRNYQSSIAVEALNDEMA
jgi:hypothetical protein